MLKRISYFLIIVLALTGCSASKVQTVWKAFPPAPYSYNQILVVAIMQDGNDSLERELEARTVRQLNSLGYHAVSYSDSYSIYGIARETTQEAAYFTLCEKGIDCVLTIAKVEETNSMQLQKGVLSRYPSSFYFNHIWNYRALKNTAGNPSPFIWECILFDLRSLEQQSVLQVTKAPGPKNEITWIAENITRKLEDDNIIRKVPVSSPRAF